MAGLANVSELDKDWTEFENKKKRAISRDMSN